MKHALGLLIGTSIDDEDKTIFKDQSWSVADYTPDFKRLEVDLEELGVPEEKVMAGVELCIGLWVRLADMDATRPVSGHKFAPAVDHCSFSGLVLDSGWAEFTGSREAYIDALVGRIDEHQKSKTEIFYDRFRGTDFFAKTNAALAQAN